MEEAVLMAQAVLEVALLLATAILVLVNVAAAVAEEVVGFLRFKAAMGPVVPVVSSLFHGSLAG